MPSSSKVALITGAARRIGAAISSILHENGYHVVIHYNTSTAVAEKLAQTLNAKRPHSALALQCDLSETKQLNLLIEKVITHFGRLDVLVNNASSFFKTDVSSVSEKEWDTLINIHMKAPFFLSQAALPHLMAQKGTIINISDIHATRPMPDYPVYSISKAGLSMLTKVLALECGPYVRVNTISPGPIIWPEGENALSSDLKQTIIERTALKKSGHPRAIAEAALFLAEGCDYITGHDLTVDGGRLIMV